MVQLLLTSLKDPAHSVRFTSASAAKYCFQSSNNHPQVVALLLEALVHILGLEQDIDILIAVVKAITTSFYHSSGSHVQFLPSLSASALRRFEIRELDFGNFKEKRDDAKDLRSLGFHLVEIAIDRGHGLDLQIGACLDEVIANFGTLVSLLASGGQVR
jgi:cullin-associated NEDD8-dissociated protein 1